MFVFVLLRMQLQRIPVVMAVGIAYVCSIVIQVIPYRHPYDLFLSAMELALAILSASVFLQVYKHPTLCLYPSRHIEAMISWIVFCGLLLLALVQEQAGLSYVADVMAKVIVLWASFCFGPGL